MAKYSLAKAAVTDLSDIFAYTFDTHGVERADSYTDALAEAFGMLCDFPNAGRKITVVRKDYRALRVGNHVIFYVQRANGDVYIVRILHVSMQPTGRLA